MQLKKSKLYVDQNYLKQKGLKIAIKKTNQILSEATRGHLFEREKSFINFMEEMKNSSPDVFLELKKQHWTIVGLGVNQILLYMANNNFLPDKKSWERPPKLLASIFSKIQCANIFETTENSGVKSPIENLMFTVKNYEIWQVQSNLPKVEEDVFKIVQAIISIDPQILLQRNDLNKFKCFPASFNLINIQIENIHLQNITKSHQVRKSSLL